MPLSSHSLTRSLYSFKPPTSSIDHLVIGGGVIGLSVAAGLVNVCGKDRTTLVVERDGLVGIVSGHGTVTHGVQV